MEPLTRKGSGMVGRISEKMAGSSVEMKMKLMKIEITIKEPNRRLLFKAGGCLRGKPGLCIIRPA